MIAYRHDGRKKMGHLKVALLQLVLDTERVSKRLYCDTLKEKPLHYRRRHQISDMHFDLVLLHCSIVC